ncbi:hypothetical protein B296_00031771 [Ensete ventricosum]|uniref:Uncharacterized protein n=1 Tax=Ensete ventricosum TaxID=4639 RepID=A0A426ZMW7_ENSVE|nr:hypothetical protein B296_00031771 [Ensete ventricosum]
MGMLLPPSMGAGCQDCDKMVLALDPYWQTDVRSSTALVWASTSGSRERWTSVHDRSVKEKQHIWFGITHLDAQATVEVGLSWSRLPPGRIRRCGCRRGELGITVVDRK